MPQDTIRKQGPKGKGGKGKIGGISWKWWAVGLVGAVAVGLYLRSRSNAAAATSPASNTTTGTPDTTGSGGASGTGSSGDNGAQTPQDLSGLTDAINNLGYIVGGLGGAPLGGDPFAPVVPPDNTPPPDPNPGVNPGGPNIPSPVVSHAGANGHSNIYNIVKLPSGATITTYTNGRRVEQAPGHTPYYIGNIHTMRQSTPPAQHTPTPQLVQQRPPTPVQKLPTQRVPGGKI